MDKCIKKTEKGNGLSLEKRELRGVIRIPEEERMLSFRGQHFSVTTSYCEGKLNYRRQTLPLRWGVFSDWTGLLDCIAKGSCVILGSEEALQIVMCWLPSSRPPSFLRLLLQPSGDC